MGAALLSFLFFMAGVVTLLPSLAAELLREYFIAFLVGLVLLGVSAYYLLAALEPHLTVRFGAAAREEPT